MIKNVRLKDTIDSIYYSTVLDNESKYKIINIVNESLKDWINVEQLTDICIETCIGNIEETGHLINSGIDINSPCFQGLHPLTLAIYYNNEELVDYYCSRGADVNYEWGNQKSNLMLASSQHNKKIINTLLRYGADVNKRDENGLNALHHLLNYPYLNGYFVDLIIFKKRRNKRNTISQCMNELLDYGIDVNATDQEKFEISALSLVMEQHDKEYDIAFKKLIENGIKREAIEHNPYQDVKINYFK